MRVLVRDGYGWVEHVAAAACESGEEIERFYRRQGELLALLYVLDAADIHSENLIAAGEHPFLVDLEALFHPLDRRPGGRPRREAGLRRPRRRAGGGGASAGGGRTGARSAARGALARPLGAAHRPAARARLGG